MTTEQQKPGNSPDADLPDRPQIGGHDPAELLKTAAAAAKSSHPRTAHGPWQPPLPEDVSAMLPGYEVTGVLGRGGMGAVYRGVQTSLERQVAIKLLPPELGADPEFETRFRREAKAMARLNHSNIVQIYDFGQTAEGHHYFVMEYVDGTDMHQYIRSGELDAEGALNAISQICDALEYAHRHGFVHRDIKPANIFINSEGVLKVGDFGLAKLVGNDDDPPLGEQLGLTMTGVALGTPHYIAPEQMVEGAHVDRRADIYSLGVMFYEMLTGELPRGAFKAPSQKLKAADKSLDVRIDGVVFKAMEPDPDERYQSAADLRTDVDGIRTTPGQGVAVDEPEPELAVATPKRVKPALVAAILLVTLIAAGAAAVFFVNGNGGKSSAGILPASEGDGASGLSGDTARPASPELDGQPAPTPTQSDRRDGRYHTTVQPEDEAGLTGRMPVPLPQRKGRYAGEPPQAPVTFPLEDPIGYPPLPTTKCRIVILRTPMSDPEVPLEGIEAVGRGDDLDIVKLANAQGESGTIVAISGSGQPILWTASGMRVSPEGEKCVEAFEFFQLTGFLWIDDAGSVHCYKNVDSVLKNELESIRHVVYAKVSRGLFFGITADGKRHLAGSGKSLDEISIVKTNMDQVHQVTFGGPTIVTVLLVNGERLVNRSFYRSRGSEGQRIGHIFSNSVFLNEMGRLNIVRDTDDLPVDADFFQQSFLNVVESGVVDIMTFQLADRSWVFWWKKSQKWEDSEKLAIALNGAAQVHVGHGNYIYALLPADTVPRSGLWDIDELIAAREKIRREKAGDGPVADGALTGRMPVPLSDPIAARLGGIEAGHRERYDAVVGQAHDQSVATLDRQISAALKREQEAAAAAGDLDAVLQWQRAVERLGGGEGVPTPEEIAAEDPPVARPEKLLAFYQSYREQVAKLAAARQEKAKPLMAERDGESEQYQRELTKAGDSEGALRVKLVREGGIDGKIPEAKTVPVAALAAGEMDLLEANKKRYQIDYSRWGTLKVVGTVMQGDEIVPVPQPDADGVDEYCFVTGRFEAGAGWMGVKKDGEIVSSFEGAYQPPHNLKKPRWLDVGTQALAVTQTGELIVWGRGVKWAPEGQLRNVVKADSASSSGIALHEDGKVSVWGAIYDQYEPEADWLENAVDVAAGSQRAFVLQNDGSVIGWNAFGDMSKQVPGTSDFSDSEFQKYLEMKALTALSGYGAQALVGLDRKGDLVWGSVVTRSPFGPLTEVVPGWMIRAGISRDERIFFIQSPAAENSYSELAQIAATAKNVISIATAGSGQFPNHYGFLAWIEEKR